MGIWLLIPLIALGYVVLLAVCVVGSGMAAAKAERDGDLERLRVAFNDLGDAVAAVTIDPIARMMDWLLERRGHDGSNG